MSISKSILLLFFLLNFSTQKLRGFTIPGRDSFVPIKSGIQTLMELTPEKSELYFTFDNQFDSSDIIILAKKAQQYTTGMYVYDSYESIKTDSEGEYINFVKELDLSEKINYITSSKKCTYYIIIKDGGKFPAKDYITIFNEQDIIELKEDEPFLIRMFLKNNLYTFAFNGEQNDIIDLELNIEDKDFSETILITKNDTEYYKGIKNQGIISLNEEKEAANYKIYIAATNNEKIYQIIKSSIILRKSKNKVRLIEPEQELNIFYINSNDFNFYVNLDDYELNEENIITFKMSHNNYKNKLIKYCYAKNMNFEEFNDNKFISNMPAHEEESESNFTRSNSYDTIYHLYFSRTKESEENKHSFLLVRCSVNIDDDAYFETEQISLFLSQRASVIDFSKEIKINEKVTLKQFIPKLYKIKIPIEEIPEDNKLSYVFYTDVKIQTVYENSILNANYKDEELLELYAISNDKLKNEVDKNEKLLYIKIFGAEQEINFRAEATEGEIYYISGKTRSYKTIGKTHLNCGNSFYFIGSYSVFAEDTYFFLEEIYGKYDIYYKNEITDKEDDSILTYGNEKYLLNKKFGNLTKTFDIIELKCQYPGYFNLHLLKNYFTKTLVLYQRQVALVNAGDIYIYPSLGQDQTKVNVEVSSPLGKKIIIDTDKYEINSTNRYFQKQYDISTLPKYIKLRIIENETIISTRLTDENLYQIVDKTSAKINEENIIFVLKNEQTYKNVNITIKRVFNDYTYTLFRGDTNYGVDMISSGYDLIPLGEKKYTINLLISNPYLKINQMIPDKSDSLFYVSFSVKDPEGYQKDISIVYNDVDKYEDDWENSVIKTLPINDNKKYNLKIGKEVEKLSILYQSCGDSLKEINIYCYDDMLNSFENKNKINLGVFNNYLIPEQIQTFFNNVTEVNNTGAQVSISLKEISKKEIDDLNNENITKLEQNGKVLNWNKLNGAKEYKIFVFNTKNENVKYIQNICYLDSIKNNNPFSKNETDPEYIGIYTTTENTYELKEEGIYYVTVMANLEDSYPLKYIFKEIEYDSKKPPKKDDDNNLALILGIVIPVVVIILVAVLIIFIIYKKKKQNAEKNLLEEGQALVRDTQTTLPD